MKRIIYFSALFLSTATWAGLQFNTTIRNVYHRGNHQRIGNYSWIVTNENIAAASSVQPIYLSLTLDHGAVLADTLVLQSGAPAVASPINLPLILDGEPGVTMVAAPDALRIVRWVAGEAAIWLEVRQSSNEWLSQGGTLMGPSIDNEVRFTIGYSARESDQLCEPGNANLPFATREAKAQEGDYAAAVSLLYCVDFRNSNLRADGSSESLLYQDHEYWESDANQGNGVYQGVTPLSCIVFAYDLACAGGKGRECAQSSFAASAPTLLPGPAGTTRSRSRLTASLGCSTGNTFLTTPWAEGSRLLLRAQGGHAGFELNPQIGFAQGWSGYAQARPETAFTHNGLTLYREAELIYTGPDLATTQQDLDFDLELLYTPSSQVQPTLEVETYLQPLATPADSAPYDGAHQHATCEDQVYEFPTQTVVLGGPAVPTLSPLALMVLIASLLLLALYHRRKRFLET